MVISHIFNLGFPHPYHWKTCTQDCIDKVPFSTNFIFISASRHPCWVRNHKSDWKWNIYISAGDLAHGKNDCRTLLWSTRVDAIDAEVAKITYKTDHRTRSAWWSPTGPAQMSTCRPGGRTQSENSSSSHQALPEPCSGVCPCEFHSTPCWFRQTH